METKNPWTTISSRLAYENKWIRIHHNEVIHPGGDPGIYGVVEFRNIAIGIIVLDEDMNTWLVGQYRYPHRKYSWEIPEGGGPKSEPEILSAQRELEEETGIKAEEWTEILRMDLSNSATDEHAVIFLARKLSFGKPMPENSEELQIRKIPFDDFLKEVLEGKITDSLTVAAALKIELMRRDGLIK
ncbi:MAG: NUDIX hydrolase [Flavobacteriales bacterium]|nr:NUDIX hydrolase [Flavobacteriales bacterium]